MAFHDAGLHADPRDTRLKPGDEAWLKPRSILKKSGLGLVTSKTRIRISIGDGLALLICDGVKRSVCLGVGRDAHGALGNIELRSLREL